MRITITDRALKETKLVAERQKMEKPAIYLDVVRTCCSLAPKVDVVDQMSGKSEIIDNVNGMPISASDLIIDLLKREKEQNDLELKVKYTKRYGLHFQLLKLQTLKTHKEGLDG
jgi:Fe-S cluster assembly iron-binding protein IscA